MWVSIGLVIALGMLLAVLAVAGRRRLGALQTALADCTARLQQQQERLQATSNEITNANRAINGAREQLAVSQENYDSAIREHAATIGELRQWAAAHLTSADNEAVQSARLVTELERYAVRTLEDQVATVTKPIILRGGLYARQLAVLDIVPELVAGLLTDVQASLLYTQYDGTHGRRFYIRWPGEGPGNSPSPEFLLGSLLQAAELPDGTAPPGSARLRDVLHALHGGGPAMLYLGPLVVARTPTRMLAGLAPAGWPGPDDDQATTAWTGLGPDLLEQIGASGVVNLTEWPAPQTA